MHRPRLPSAGKVKRRLVMTKSIVQLRIESVNGGCESIIVLREAVPSLSGKSESAQRY